MSASKNSRHNTVVTVLDNKSTDGSVEFIKENFSDVNLYLARENRVLCSFNEFGKASEEETGRRDLLIADGYLTEWYEWVSSYPASEIAR